MQIQPITDVTKFLTVQEILINFVDSYADIPHTQISATIVVAAAAFSIYIGTKIRFNTILITALNIVANITVFSFL